MTPEFQYSEEQYKDELRKSTSFIGQDVDFFAEAKALHLLDICARLRCRPSSAAILDVGCGVGMTDRFLAGHVGELHGVDLSEQELAGAAKSNPTVQYKQGDGAALPYEDDTFDVVFTVNVMHHVPPADQDNFVREMQRVAKRDGLVVVFEHNPLNPLTRLAVLRCSFDRGCELLPRRKVARILTGSGLARAESRYIMFFPSRSPALARIQNRIGWLPLGAQYYVAGRKV